MFPVIDLEELHQRNLNYAPGIDLEELCNGVVYPVTNETIPKYRKLVNNPLLRDEWLEAMCTQGYGKTPRTNIFVL